MNFVKIEDFGVKLIQAALDFDKRDPPFYTSPDSRHANAIIRHMVELFKTEIVRHAQSTYDYVVKSAIKANSEAPDTAYIRYGFLESFHKGFRQVDVLPDGHHDMIVWHAMQDSDVISKAYDYITRV